MAASPGCVPTFTAEAGSVKCCSGQIKTMRIIIRVTDPTNCVGSTEPICIVSVRPSTGNPSVGTTTFVPGPCTTEGGTITVFLFDVSNCTVNLTVTFTVGGGPIQSVALKSANITDGGAAVCPVLAPEPEEPVVESESSKPPRGADTSEQTATPTG
jgi:hypothetical protein